ncbi:MAG: galactose mutarotase [Bacteroidales bacterium]|nr:galactose mutarotase [Bacteroidales bacterium]
MRKFFVLALCAMILIGCTKKNEVNLMNVNDFNTEVDGKKVSLYTLKNGFLTMQVTNYGGRVVSLWMPDYRGSFEDIVLGYDNIDRYINCTGERYLGAVVGRCANRIAHGEFTLDGKKYELYKNNDGNTLHGGEFGVDRVVWDVKSVNDTAIVLHVVLPDGLDGFPGNLDITMTYALTADNEFHVDYLATTDAPTVCNLSHHSFFNLKGEGNGTILDHEMMINGKLITVIDKNLIPTGNFIPVKGTPMDFMQAKPIGRDIEAYHPQMVNGGGYDFNWVLNKPIGQMGLAASVFEPESGRAMEVYTDQPGMQFYSGNFFDGKTTGKYGKPLCNRASFALETQQFPDAINQPNFPSVVLRPGEEYHHTCIYKFDVKKPTKK